MLQLFQKQGLYWHVKYSITQNERKQKKKQIYTQTGLGVVITHTLTDVALHTATSHCSSALIKDATHQFAWPGQTQTCCPLCCSSTSSVWTGTGTPWCQSWLHLQCRSCGPGTAGRASSGPAYRTAAAAAPAAEKRLAEISPLMVWYFSGPSGEILPVLDQSLGVRALELQRRSWKGHRV